MIPREHLASHSYSVLKNVKIISNTSQQQSRSGGGQSCDRLGDQSVLDGIQREKENAPHVRGGKSQGEEGPNSLLKSPSESSGRRLSSSPRFSINIQAAMRLFVSRQCQVVYFIFHNTHPRHPSVAPCRAYGYKILIGSIQRLPREPAKIEIRFLFPSVPNPRLAALPSLVTCRGKSCARGTRGSRSTARSASNR